MLALLCLLGAGLNVSPVQIHLKPDEAKALLTLRNDGAEPVRYQLQVNTWDEDARSGMKLGPTEDIVFFPAMLTLKPGETHNVRVGAAVPFGNAEKTYRIFVAELPPAETPQQPRSTVRVLTRVGIPIFLEPSQVLEAQQLSPLEIRDGKGTFEVRNTGNVHLRVEEVKLAGYEAGGARVFEKVSQGWYLLAGGSKRYSLEVPREGCAKVRKLVAEMRTDKDQRVEQPLPTPGGACGG